MKLQEAGDSCTVRSFIICILDGIIIRMINPEG
jgi:hypothetical protein